MTRKYFDDNKSNKSGISRVLEKILRKTKTLSYTFMFLAIAAICITCGGLAVSIGISTFKFISHLIENNLNSLSPVLIGINFFFSYFISGISLVFLAPFFNWLFRLNKIVKPFRGGAYSLESIPWFLHNALLYLVRYSFLEFITPSPLNVLFYRMMGMKIGKGVVINTTNISDACLIEIGNYVTIGGSAHLLAHYSTSGYLVLSTLKIGDSSTIGLKATVFGNVEIGKNCLVKPHSVVLPKTKMEDGSSL